MCRQLVVRIVPTPDTEAKQFAGSALDLLALGFQGALQQLVAVLQIPVIPPVLVDAPNKTEEGTAEGYEMVKGLEHKVRWRELHLFNLVKKRPRGNLITAYNCLKGTYKYKGDKLFLLETDGVTRTEQRGNLIFKTEILDHFHEVNTSIQARVHKEWAHPPQQPQELIKHAEGKIQYLDCSGRDLDLMESPHGAITVYKGGRDEDVGAVLFDDGINELLRGGSPAQEADAPLKLRHQGQWIVEQVPPLDGCVPHLPTGKLPMRQHRNTTGVRLRVRRGRESHQGQGRRMAKRTILLDTPTQIHTTTSDTTVSVPLPGKHSLIVPVMGCTKLYLWLTAAGVRSMTDRVGGAWLMKAPAKVTGAKLQCSRVTFSLHNKLLILCMILKLDVDSLSKHEQTGYHLPRALCRGSRGCTKPPACCVSSFTGLLFCHVSSSVVEITGFQPLDHPPPQSCFWRDASLRMKPCAPLVEATALDCCATVLPGHSGDKVRPHKDSMAQTSAEEQSCNQDQAPLSLTRNQIGMRSLQKIGTPLCLIMFPFSTLITSRSLLQPCPTELRSQQVSWTWQWRGTVSKEKPPLASENTLGYLI
ncbi:hypothetical protein QYF61_010348 [Mycteria americana]|uniref:Uncharacterized protein n=1 Tax=Mycteria americana TaxID=33587 RepID=A0AAN7MR91_MYCAM|nr:hypothetical protein QYF61_010348 [Mycteria americana]